MRTNLLHPRFGLQIHDIDLNEATGTHLYTDNICCSATEVDGLASVRIV